MNTKWLPHSILFILSFTIIFFLGTWIMPKLEATLKLTIENQIRKNTPFTILPEKVEFNLLPLKMKFSNTKFLPNEKIKSITNPFTIKKIELKVSFFDLLFGKFKLRQLEIEETSIDLFFKIKKDPNSKLPDIFPILNQIPIAEIILKKINLNLGLGNLDYSLKTINMDLSVYNEKNSLFINLNTEKIYFYNTIKELKINSSLVLKAMISPKSFIISELQATKDESFFIASGSGSYDLKSEKITNIDANARTELTFQDINEILLFANQNSPIKDFQGINRIEVSAKSKNQETLLEFTTLTRNFMIEKIKLFNVSSEGTFFKNVAKLEELTIEHPGGSVVAKNSTISLDKKKINIPKLELKNFNLNKFLTESTITKAPVFAQVDGFLECLGGIEGNFSLDCNGNLIGKNIIIKNASGVNTIVNVKALEAIGKVQINENEVSYDTKLKSQMSEGESKGVINYHEGFDISYSSERLNLDEIKEISGLSMSGITSIKGSTKGNSDTAVFNMNIKAQNYIFKNYSLGDVSSYLHYKSGDLIFDDINATLGSSRYRGRLAVNLVKDSLESTLSFPYLRLQDLQKAIEKPISIPTELKGSGSAQIKFWGPFDVKKINFDLTSIFFRGEVFRQSFEELRLPIVARDGHMKIEQAKSKVKSSVITWDGKINPELITNINYFSDAMYLKDFDFIDEYKIPANGFMNLNGKIQGPIDKAQVTSEGVIESLSFNKRRLDKLKFSIFYDPEKFRIETNIKDQLNIDLQIPQTDRAPFFIKGLINNFDVVPLVSYSLSQNPKEDYSIETSALFDLTGENFNFWNMAGDVKISNINIKQSGDKMSLQKSANLNLKNGILNFENIRLIGNNQFLDITDLSKSITENDFRLTGEVDLSYFFIFAPFFENLDGLTTFKLNFKNSKNSNLILGSALIESGTIKLEDFDYPLNNLKSDILFNQNEVIVNSLKGNLAEGELLGSGKVKFDGSKNFPVNFNINIENANLEMPDNINTNGNAKLKVTGSWFPFLIEGSYNVMGGFIDYEIGGKQDQKIRDDSLLPPALRQVNESPIAFNIDVNTLKKVDIKNSFIEGYGVANFNLSGVIGAIQMNGKASLTQTTKIIFKDTEFNVLDSSFKFSHKSNIDPEIFLRASARVKSYDVQLLIQGRSSKPIIKFSSTPSLSENEIISLLALGSTTNSSSLIASNTGTSGIDTTQTSTGLGENTQGLEVGTSLLSNNPLGREFKQRTGFDINFSSNVANEELSGATVILSKKLNNQVQVTASHRTGKRSESTLRLRRNFDNNFSGAMIIKNQNFQEVQDSSINQGTFWGLDLEYKKEFK